MKTFGELRYYPPHTRNDRWGNAAVGLWEVMARPDVITRVKRLFPRASKYRSGAVVLHHTPEVARDLEWILERWPLVVHDDALRLLRAEADKHRRNEELVHEILSGAIAHVDSATFMDPIREPRDYQLVAADLALHTGRLLLADDLGLGKTMSGLLVLRNPEALPALVVCPGFWSARADTRSCCRAFTC